MKVLISFSGGKDSEAALIWAVKESGFKNIEAVFCDTGWEHELTYAHISNVCQKLGVKLVVLKSNKYEGFVDLAVKKKRFPSTKARFCTEELKIKPMIDYILSHNENLIIIQGIRKDESNSRSKMGKQCRFFKYYFEPYGFDKNGKPKKHTYRKKDVIEFCKNYSDDILRPVFDWSGVDVMNYILNNGFRPNNLYFQDFKRVGCFPCIMYGLGEINSMVKNQPEYIERLKQAEKVVGRTFSPPNYIPKKYCTKTDPKSGKKIASVDDVIRYVKDRNPKELFDNDTSQIFMSYYGICE